MKIAPKPPAAISGPKAAGPNAAATPATKSPTNIHGTDGLDGVGQPQAATTPEQIAKNFYDAFVNGRTEELRAFYAPDVKFQDMVFKYNDRDGVMHMWKSILKPEPGKKFTYTFDRMEGDVAVGRWVADYKVFGRPVHNELESRLTIRDGKIVEHRDSSSWSKWARQAFPLGAFGASKFFRMLATPVLRFAINSSR